MPDEHSPVRFIEPDERNPEAPADGIALCLSGGGYRAMLFHLGALKCLNDVGYLCVSSVFGGSITAGILGMNWKRLAFQNDRAPNFDDEVTRSVRKLGGPSARQKRSSDCR